MKIAALLLALALTLATTSSCGESTEVQYDEPKVAVEEIVISEPEPKPDPSKYDGITNIFVSPLEDIDIDLRAEDVNIYQYNAW